MLNPENIRRRALASYADFLRSVVNESLFFPLQIRFGKPSATEDFDKLRGEITALTKASLGCQIEWTEVNSRRWGKQRLPERVGFVEEASYLRAIGKTKEVVRFRENLALTHEECPALIPLVETRPLDAVEFADVWPGLLKVCCYFQSHPRPNRYARELPLPVDTKFIERHQSVLSRLLAAALPPETIVQGERFEERFGIRFDEPLIRLRLLDKSLRDSLHVPFPDLAVPLSCFRDLDWQGLLVIVAENKMTFLTLPRLTNAIGIWGAGNAAALIHGVGWLSKCHILYWGDLDTQGLEILSRLRNSFPQVQSLMMDIGTLNRFQGLCIPGTRSNSSTPTNLTLSEASAWSTVHMQNLRLEQERLPPSLAEQAMLEALTSLRCSPSVANGSGVAKHATSDTACPVQFHHVNDGANDTSH